MKVIGVNGSPHMKQNVAYLVGKVLEGAEGAGARTSMLHLQKMKVSPCIACLQCRKGKPCSIKDDMYRFYDAVEEGCGLVLGFPIYFDHVSAQFKAFLDRLYVYLHPGLENHFPRNVRAVLVTSYGAGGEKAYDGVVEWTRQRLHGYWQIETIGAVKLHGCPDDRLVAPENEALVRRALDLGALLAAGRDPA
jgi:multimeric flavodoxin WrbA